MACQSGVEIWSGWGRHAGTRRRSHPSAFPESPALYAYLLDADDELAEELDLRERFTARQHATARVLEAEPVGVPWSPGSPSSVTGRGC